MWICSKWIIVLSCWLYCQIMLICTNKKKLLLWNIIWSDDSWCYIFSHEQVCFEPTTMTMWFTNRIKNMSSFKSWMKSLVVIFVLCTLLFGITFHRHFIVTHPSDKHAFQSFHYVNEGIHQSLLPMYHDDIFTPRDSELLQNQLLGLEKHILSDPMMRLGKLRSDAKR